MITRIDTPIQKTQPEENLIRETQVEILVETEAPRETQEEILVKMEPISSPLLYSRRSYRRVWGSCYPHDYDGLCSSS